MPQLHYLIGDATAPTCSPAIIAHCCNSSNGWGRGFVLALSAKFPEPEREYHNWFTTGKPQLGDVQFVTVKPNLIVANIIGQEGTRWQGNVPPIRYPAITQGLAKVFEKAKQENYSVVMPRIGAVLAGGDWPTIEKIIQSTMTVETYVYTIEAQKDRWPTVYENDTQDVHAVPGGPDIDLNTVFK
jgi:O-acetyl-ADP-ribose deacetylase (regulator of RNase III)